MPALRTRERSRLPDRAFAYIDASGRRRLPINDAAHVRNALARFNQVIFENEAGRDAARRKLLNAAKKHGIVPVGFITGQLKANRTEPLPTGQLTMLLADIEGSTGLLRTLGDDYQGLLGQMRTVLRTVSRRLGGHEVGVHGDEYFAVFRHAPDALRASIDMHRALRQTGWPGGVEVRVRVGLHTGRPTLTEHGYIGVAIHAASRIMTAGHGGQLLLSESTVRALGDDMPKACEIKPLGLHRLRGLPNEMLYQAVVPDLPSEFPPLRTEPAGIEEPAVAGGLVR